MYIEQLAFSWMGDSTGQKIRADVKTKIKDFANGDLEHATEALSALWEIANTGGDVKAPSDNCEVVVCNKDPAHREAVGTALLKSIHDGIFFDRKYWARHSKAGDALKPVFFSSIVMDDRAQELGKCRSKAPHWYAKVLNVPSDKIRQRSKPPYE